MKALVGKTEFNPPIFFKSNESCQFGDLLGKGIPLTELTIKLIIIASIIKIIIIETNPILTEVHFISGAV